MAEGGEEIDWLDAFSVKAIFEMDLVEKERTQKLNSLASLAGW